jgi:8-oxo-dGTP pyrophosphatase MutT (NUDIX family)
MPAGLVDSARAFLREGREPVPPRDAATVMLLRDTVAGVEVYLLRRRATMAFAAGMYVFPGGGVDERDDDTSVAWAGPDPSTWAVRLRCEEGLARALVCAAVRETFEESGVLLAGPEPASVVADTSGDDWEADRLALLDRSLSLTQLLARRGLVLRADLLGAWARWITPVFESRRYDTRFFVAVLPPGQRPRDVSTEAASVAWLRPADAVAAVDRGEMAMLPPTYQSCVELAALGGTAEVLAAAAERDVRPVEPRLVVEGESMYLDLE